MGVRNGRSIAKTDKGEGIHCTWLQLTHVIDFGCPIDQPGSCGDHDCLAQCPGNHTPWTFTALIKLGRSQPLAKCILQLGRENIILRAPSKATFGFQTSSIGLVGATADLWGGTNSSEQNFESALQKCFRSSQRKWD